MTKLLKKTEFEHTVTKLWDKIKDNFIKGKKFNRVNIADRKQIVKGYRYLHSSPFTWQKASGWSTIFLDATVGKRYTLYIKSSTPVTTYFVFTKTIGGPVVRVPGTGTFGNPKGSYVYDSFIIQAHHAMPSGDFKLAISLQDSVVNLNEVDSVMLFEVPSNQVADDVDEFIPFGVNTTNMLADKESKYYFDSTGTVLDSTTIDGAIKELSSSASQGKDNVLGGKTLLANGNIIGRIFAQYTNNGANEKTTSNKSWFTTGNLNISSISDKITQITIAMDDNIPVGTIVDGVNIAIAKNTGPNAYYMELEDCLLSNGKAVVYNAIEPNILGSSKAITVDIEIDPAKIGIDASNRRLVIGVNGAKCGAVGNVLSASGDDFPGVTGQRVDFTMADGRGKSASYILHTEETPLLSLVKDLRVDEIAKTITVTKASGDASVIRFNFGTSNGGITQQTTRVGRTRRYAIDPAQGIAPFSIRSTNSSDSDVPVEDETTSPTVTPPIIDSGVVRKFAHIHGVKIEMDNECWLKCEGQDIEHSVTGEPITLPTSKVGDYIYLCLGH